MGGLQQFVEYEKMFSGNFIGYNLKKNNLNIFLQLEGENHTEMAEIFLRNRLLDPANRHKTPADEFFQ